jgi:membrane-bound lytic murein transglycosylase B
MILALVALTGAAGLYLVPAAARSGLPAQAEPAASSDGPGTAGPSDPGQVSQPPPLPTPTPTRTNLTGRPSDVFAGWALQMSTRTEVPAVAMQAYSYAEWVMSQQQPACKLTWPTLAAIGKVESNHGRANSATLTSDGRAYPFIYGPALDGQGGRELIRDTDLGNLDRDQVYDRAVGPMQFIPSTWQQYQVDADDDGQRDPHDIDDAALAAAKLLCARGRDLTTADGWWQAVLSYNEVRPYADAVYAAANDYGRRSRNTP